MGEENPERISTAALSSIVFGDHGQGVEPNFMDRIEYAARLRAWSAACDRGDPRVIDEAEATLNLFLEAHPDFRSAPTE